MQEVQIIRKLAPVLALFAVLAVASSAHGSTFCIQNENLRICRTPVPGGVRICTTARLETFTVHRCRVQRGRARGASFRPRLSIARAKHILAAREDAWDITPCRRLSSVSVLCEYRQATATAGIEVEEDPHAYFATSSTVERLPSGRIVIR